MEKNSVSNLGSKDQTQIEMPPESVCSFRMRENTSRESKGRFKSVAKLSGLIVFYTMIMLVEVIGGVKANSLFLMADGAHLLTDVVGFSISLLTVWASGRKTASYQSFRFNRLEVLGALLSVQLIWLISAFFIYTAFDRIVNENKGIDTALLFGIAEIGFVAKVVMLRWLGHCRTHHSYGDTDHHQHQHLRLDLEKGEPCELSKEVETSLVLSSLEKTKILNINPPAAHLYVGDLIQSVGVMIAAAVIWIKPNWFVVDLLCTIFLSTVALCTAILMVRDIYGILMLRTPRGINLDMLESGIKGIKGVQNIHDLHVWAVKVGELVLECHVVAKPGANSDEILCKIKNYCDKTYKIRHMTVQIE